MKKRILTGLLALCMLCGLAACGGPASDRPAASTGGLASEPVRDPSGGPVQDPSAEPPENPSAEPPALLTPPSDATDSGSCGDGVWWAYDENTQTLTIGGSGEMEPYDTEYLDDEDRFLTMAPWSVYAELIRVAVIENGITRIGEGAFTGCTGLASVAIPGSVTSIRAGAFVDCTSLTSLTIPNSVTSVEPYAFGGCTSLTSVTISNGITFIQEGVFQGCTSLTSVTIPDSVTEIREGAFRNCTSLTSVTIPTSVTSVDHYAFEDCTALTDVYYTGTEEQRTNTLYIGSTNEPLLNASFHYNSAG